MSTIVIGAGIAGLAAAQYLHKAGHEVTILEAKDRIGGRVYTNRSFTDHPVELGAELIHGENAATWELVNRLGLKTVHWEKQDDAIVKLENGLSMSMREARASYPNFDVTRSWDIPDVEAFDNEDWHSYLSRIGFDAEQLRYVKRSFANATGESMRFLSAQAILESLDDTKDNSGENDYRILNGYDKLIDHLAQDLLIMTDDPVSQINSQKGAVRIESLGDDSYEADNCIISVPLGVLQSESIVFNPALGHEKMQALKGLKMGPVIKMIYVFDEHISDKSISAIYSRHNPPMWWSPSYGHSSNEQVWTAFVSGGWAMELLGLGEEEALEHGLKMLSNELGKTNLKAKLMHLENWPEDPYTKGGYSVVLPGHYGARAALAKPTPPLFWAGEACATPEGRAQTVHGAYLSGLRAAQEVLETQ